MQQADSYVQWRTDDHREFKQDNGINFRNKKLNNRKIIERYTILIKSRRMIRAPKRSPASALEKLSSAKLAFRRST